MGELRHRARVASSPGHSKIREWPGDEARARVGGSHCAWYLIAWHWVNYFNHVSQWAWLKSWISIGWLQVVACV